MRRLIGAVVVVALALAVGWWFCRPTPGASLFANWDPHAKGKVWSIVGSPDSPHIAFVDPTGAFQPREDSYSVHYYLYDRDSRRLCTARPTCSLAYGCLPTVDIDCGGVAARYETFVTDGECVSIVTLRNGGGFRVSLFAVVLPYQLTGPMLGSAEVRCDGRSLVVGGRKLLACDTMPVACAAYAAGTDDRTCDVTGYAREGMLPGTRVARGGPKEITSGVMRFDLTLQPNQEKRLVFRSPLGPRARRIEARQAREEFVRRWDSRLGRVDLDVPDQRVRDCFRASAAYLVMLSANGRPVPGPTKYGSFWVRDCAYMADALYYAGHGDLVGPALKKLRSMQLPNGGFAARSGAGDVELDAPGEAIYTLVSRYRRTHDRKWLAAQWECIERTCRYVKAKGMGQGGILPASLSAEDLGKGDQQHYWDDFWCIRGLRDAAYAARELGRREDAAWTAAEAESLSQATRMSIEATMARHSTDYIPNGPDEVTSSSMARGTSCALWPCAVLEPSDALARRSFDVYWSKWIAPSGGGFIHREHFWPYAGMDLAQGYVMLGQRERAWKMLEWTLAHDPTRGFYSWPEGMFTNDLTLAEGDMPHGWMCAAYVSMVRNMLVRESGRDLVLLSGVPSEWLRPGARISVRDFPTEFGKASFDARVVNDTLQMSLSGARPLGTYRIELPGGPTEVLPRDARTALVRL